MSEPAFQKRNTFVLDMLNTKTGYIFFVTKKY